jgi:predicted glycoside hydrolase/deacetylase ChbG (UPF0249 family)
MPPEQRLSQRKHATVTKYLVVNADDLGMCTATNFAIARAFQQGLVTSASLMANMPAFPHAVRHVIGKNRGLGMGVHLCLSSGRPALPASEVPLLVDDHGYFKHGFVGLLWLLRSRRRASAIGQIERELTAQVARIRGRGIAIDHLDSHQHVHMIPDIFPLAAALAGKHHAAIRVADEASGLAHHGLAGLLPCLFDGGLLKQQLLSRLAQSARRAAEFVPSADHYVGVLHSGKMIGRRLQQVLERLPDVVSEINVHPGQAPAADDSPGRALCCSRPDQRFWRSPNRALELAALLDGSLRQRVAELGISLVRFSDVLPRLQMGRTTSAQRAAA